MLLEILDLKVNHGGAECLKGISILVDDGEMVTIIGSNGAGKTTTLRTVSGLKRSAAGNICFRGKRINESPPQDIVRLGIGHVPQGRALFPYMSVLENLKIGSYLQKDAARIKMALEGVFLFFPVLKSRKKQQAGTLSGGEQQMLAIARALMGDPVLLLLDEPSIGLAPIVVREIGEVAREINRRGTGILIVEQNARLALKLAQRGYVMETGKIVLEGPCRDLLNDPGVNKAYLGN